MRKSIMALLLCATCISCSDTIEGLLGEWEGTDEHINDKGEPFESKITCTISSLSNSKRRIILKDGGASYEFEAEEHMDVLTFKDYPLGKDSSVIPYISGTAELRFDTLLYFEYQLYSLLNGAFRDGADFDYGLVRK
ncbi:MAG: hypothetical protein AAGA77_21770 [Bacteroidota bacterium]